MANETKSVSRSIYLDVASARTEAKKLETDITKIGEAIKKGEAAGKDMTKSIQEMAEKQTKVKELNAQLQGLAPTLREQTATVRQLANELNRMSANTPEFKQKLEIFKQQNAALAEMKARINGVKEESNKMLSGLEEIGKKFLAFASVTFIAEKIGEFFKTGIEESLEFEKALVNLKNSLENVGRGDLFEQLKGDAEKLHETYKAITPEAFVNVFARFVDYGKLSKNQIEQLTPVIVDFARKQQISIEEASGALIKGLEGNGRALKQYGVNMKDGNSVTERFGFLVNDLGKRLKGTELAFENTRMGGWQVFTTWIKETAKNFGDFIMGVDKSADEAKKAVSVFDEQKEKVIVLNKNLPPLIQKYDELKTKAHLSQTEHAELNKTISAIGQIVPGAITQFDSYGRAIDVDISKVQDFIKNQKLMLQVMNKDAIEQNEKLRDNLNMQRRGFQNELNSGITYESVNNGMGGTSSKPRKLEPDEIISLQGKIQDLTNQAIGYTQVINHLKGVDLETPKTPEEEKAEQIEALKKKLKEGTITLKEYNSELKKLNDTGSLNSGANLDSDDDNKKNHYKTTVEQAKNFKKEMEQLQAKAHAATKSNDEKEIEDVQIKYNALLAKYDNFLKQLHGKDKQDFEAAKKAITAAELDEINATLQKQFTEHAADEYKQALADNADYFAEEKNRLSQLLVNNEISQKDYNADIVKLDEQAAEQRKKIAIDYSNVVKQAAADVTNFDRNERDKQTQNNEKHYQDLKKAQDDFNKLQQQVEDSNAQTKLSSAKPGTKAYYDAQLAVLKAAHEKRLAELKKERDEIAQTKFSDDPDKNKSMMSAALGNIDSLIGNENTENANKVKNLKDEEFQAQVNKYVNIAKEGVNILDQLGQAATNAENRRFEVMQKNAEKEKTTIQNLASHKIITAQEAAARQAALDNRLDKQKRTIEQQQFRRQQAIQIANVFIDSAAADIKLWHQPGPPAAYALTALLAVQTAASIALISSQKPAFKKGALLDGPSHDEGGMPIINPRTGGKVAEIEGGEAILSKNTVANNRGIVGALLNSSLHYNGAAIKPFWLNRPYQSFDYTGIARSFKKFDTGGVFANSQSEVKNIEAASQQATINNNMVEQLTQALNNFTAQTQQPITAYVTQKQMEDSNTRKATIMANAKIG